MPATGGASPWWSDALSDPWRDPHAPTAVFLQQAADQGVPLEPVPDPDAAPRRGFGPSMILSVVLALLAGLLGGALGFAFATRNGGGGGAQLGAGATEVPA
ncbi:MAG TPA: peptidase S1, partial [Micromonosporaceae bacterium]|nr:peptidase S1 [Micromonosporaceae bacterium]